MNSTRSRSHGDYREHLLELVHHQEQRPAGGQHRLRRRDETGRSRLYRRPSASGPSTATHDNAAANSWTRHRPGCMSVISHGPPGSAPITPGERGPRPARHWTCRYRSDPPQPPTGAGAGFDEFVRQPLAAVEVHASDSWKARRPLYGLRTAAGTAVEPSGPPTSIWRRRTARNSSSTDPGSVKACCLAHGGGSRTGGRGQDGECDRRQSGQIGGLREVHLARAQPRR